MAPRDYVKRGKGSRKTVQRRKTSLENNNFAKQKMFFLLFLLVAGFIYFLHQLSSQPTSNTDDVQPPPPQSITTNNAVDEQDELPALPKEKWSYITALENKNVQVEANEQQVSERPYLMQCGAWRSEVYAEERKAKIAFQGLASQIKVSLVNDVLWYRVVLGPYDLKRKAESDRNLLRKAGIEPCKIWFWED